ncbi:MULTISPECIES: bifunctional diaminohydroxyphosphoribosylaminopyrimidine deaminase/5-amino-6-(5-phosphoribosylamino)uracil reductase RibD [Eikenella]|uniref:bifunctional diaminohydroxyphosphoribosylaminopyrimidine deaminase/5-amino-6-(5-phosphoribosylamino)uracil reductase RibD n=1 Tax=Eikenella TaxID=538 RepID=UPI0007E0B6A8|nr:MULTISPECIES: bifunctional diaminohydroxyphosphoribosylaminopyrimidine deaminase/5-amino-6-(5-phosphoribosylamino)uracil reductase RibD [Eikenella]OAM40009.1 riboflavin biosynthesis protein RibD [Eikenella sp. NML120348]
MPQFSPADHALMQQAIALAWQGRFSTSPNPRVGCVIAQGGQIVGQGFHLKAGEPHAEVRALRQAGSAAQGATAYITLEPCAHHGRTPPCAEALNRAGVRRVVAAMQDPNPLVAGKGLSMLEAAGIQVACGLMEREARQLNRGFLSRIERGRPFVKLKTAASLDGKTALANGQSQWITGEAARHDVQIQRAESCAVLTGIGTALADNPRLTVRDFPTLRAPLRVLLDSRLRLPAGSHLLDGSAPTLIYTLSDSPAPAAAEICRLKADAQGRLNLSAVLADLAARGIGELMLEAGATLGSAFLAQDLVDEIVCYQAPKLLGGTQSSTLFRLPENPAALSCESNWHTISVEQLGDDIKWVLQNWRG